jgi:hypothetical protein
VHVNQAPERSELDSPTHELARVLGAHAAAILIETQVSTSSQRSDGMQRARSITLSIVCHSLSSAHPLTTLDVRARAASVSLASTWETM